MYFCFVNIIDKYWKYFLPNQSRRQAEFNKSKFPSVDLSVNYRMSSIFVFSVTKQAERISSIRVTRISIKF